MTKTIKEVLDNHAKWYIRRAIEMLKRGEESQFVTARNEQDTLALKEIEAIMQTALEPEWQDMREQLDGKHLIQYENSVVRQKNTLQTALYGKDK